MGRFQAGERFGSWTTLQIERSENSKGKRTTYWKCRCDCGTVKLCNGYDLTGGKSTQCSKCSGSDFQDLTGLTFSEWTVLEFLGTKNNHPTWKCKCACGSIKEVSGKTLKRGTSKRCHTCSGKRKAKHGYLSGERHPLYNIWMTMIARCENPKCSSYSYYGARGIKVCKRWHDLNNFAEDMGERPFKYTIERIDNDGNYEPSNCRWASYTEQARNRRNNRLLSVHGKTQVAQAWADEWNIKHDTLWHYLDRNTMEEAVLHYEKGKI